MNLTSLFRLRKPEGTDPVNIEDFNDNFDVIDTELGKRPLKTDPANDMTVAFSQAANRANLTTGEKLSISFGKIMKWFADMATVAFSGSYTDLSNKPSIPGGAAASQGVANNCTTTAEGYVLDARQGKMLMDKANQISSDLDKVNVYVGSDGKLHYVNKDGADTALPFSSGPFEVLEEGILSKSVAASSNNYYTIDYKREYATPPKVVVLNNVGMYITHEVTLGTQNFGLRIGNAHPSVGWSIQIRWYAVSEAVYNQIFGL